MTLYPKICVLLSALVPLICCSVDTEEQKNAKLISTFQVVRFPNDACQGSNSRNGTCYTSQECTSKDGTSAGSCADGFGVCCTFIINTCGSTSSENLTVWTQPTTIDTTNDAVSCGLTICPMSDDICSLRLDFTTFTITGPNTYTQTTVRRLLGAPFPNQADAIAADNLQGSNFNSNCLVDIFYSTSASPSSTPPAICGTNTGQHMYVEADIDRCNALRFNLGDATLATQITTGRGLTTTVARAWDITISQIECGSVVKPPTGCTKYFWGSADDTTLTNYNYGATVAAANAHLAMQHERMCIRRERGNCIGCFKAGGADFSVSWIPANNMNIVVTAGCCGYGTQELLTKVATDEDGAKLAGNQPQFGWDCVIIPGAFIPTADDNGTPVAAQTNAVIQQVMNLNPTAGISPSPSGPQICGNGAGLGAGKATLELMAIADIADAAFNEADDHTICTRNIPFVLEFMSDDMEGLGMAAADESEGTEATQIGNQGFTIVHEQLAC